MLTLSIAQEGCASGRGFLEEDIEASVGDLIAVECLNKTRLIYQRSAVNIDEVRFGLHRGEHFGVDEAVYGTTHAFWQEAGEGYTRQTWRASNSSSRGVSCRSSIKNRWKRLAGCRLSAA